MASKLTRKKKNKKEEPPNDDVVNLSVEFVKTSQEKTTKKRKDIEDEQIDVNEVWKVDEKKSGEASNNRFWYERGTFEN